MTRNGEKELGGVPPRREEANVRRGEETRTRRHYLNLILLGTLCPYAHRGRWSDSRSKGHFDSSILGLIRHGQSRLASFGGFVENI